MLVLYTCDSMLATWLFHHSETDDSFMMQGEPREAQKSIFVVQTTWRSRLAILRVSLHTITIHTRH